MEPKIEKIEIKTKNIVLFLKISNESEHLIEIKIS